MKQTIKLNSETDIDLPKLIGTKLLVQANSGGGKSHTIRRILEQSHGHVQHIILDPEGEFSTLREKYEYILVGKDNDVAASTKTAAKLAEKLLEFKTSAIIDLYELHPQERKHYVKLFVEALVNAPKTLWHPVLVVIDEIHTFAPEKGESEALSAVINLASLGRKREFCLIGATQRISKLHKDIAAECNNKLIGRTGLDIDQRRAADELGFTSKEQIRELRNLEAGEFYIYGPAISREVRKITVGDVQTQPPKTGQKSGTVPKPTEKIKGILAKLADLPAEVHKEAVTISSMQEQIRTLTRENGELKRNPGVTKIDLTQFTRNEQVVKMIDFAVSKVRKEWDQERQGWIKQIDNWFKILKSIGEISNKALEDYKKTTKFVSKQSLPKDLKIEPGKIAIIKPQAQPINQVVFKPESGLPAGELSGPEQRILDAIAWLESIGNTEPEQTAVAFLADYTIGGGAFNNPKGSLKTKGLIVYRGNSLVLTDEGRKAANVPEGTLTTEELHNKILNRLPGPEKKLMQALLEAYPNSLTNEELAERTGYMAGGGAFNNPKGRLKTLGLIEYPEPRTNQARSILFL